MYKGILQGSDTFGKLLIPDGLSISIGFTVGRAAMGCRSVGSEARRCTVARPDGRTSASCESELAKKQVNYLRKE